MNVYLCLSLICNNVYPSVRLVIRIGCNDKVCESSIEVTESCKPVRNSSDFPKDVRSKLWGSATELPTWDFWLCLILAAGVLGKVGNCIIVPSKEPRVIPSQ